MSITTSKQAKVLAGILMAAILPRAETTSTSSASTCKFSDVKKSDYFYKACIWGSEKGIVEGYKDGTFRPDGDCLRRQMVTFLYKYSKNVK